MSKVKLMELSHDLAALIKRKPLKEGSSSPSHRACRILALIKLQGSMNQRTLATNLGIRPQSLSEVITRLEKDGFIIRVEDETNKKANMIVLTPKGAIEATKAHNRIKNHATTFFATLSDDETATFIALIEKTIHSNNNEYISEDTKCQQ